MKVEQMLNQFYDRFSENEKYLCHYLTGHYEDCAKSTLAEFAKGSSVSQTTWIRFAKKIGLSGYGELKARIKMELKEGRALPEGLMEKVTQSYHKMMDDLVKRDLKGIFDLIYEADKVFAYGSGSSQARVASEMTRIFLPLKQMIHIHGHDMIHAIQKIARPQDLVFLISLSGESDNVVELGKALRVNHVPTVSVTRMKNNTLASLCTENLYIHSVQMPVEYGMEYEISTPYFILTEFLYLSYGNYLAER